MHVDPAIALLRTSKVEQHRLTVLALSLERQWLAGATGKALTSALARTMAAHVAGCPVADDDRAVLLGDWGAAFLEFWSRAWRAEPLLQLPLRHHASATTFSLIAAQHQGALLSLAVIDHHRWQAQQAACVDEERISFHPGLVHLRLLAGEGLQGEIATLSGDRLARGKAEPIPPGTDFVLDGAHQALRITAMPQTILLQRLALPCQAPDAVAHDVRLADGAIMARTSAHRRASETQMHLALLRAMGRTDAAPVMAELALAPGSAHDRWQAARECLATDSATGLALLARLAHDPDPQLRHIAMQTSARLLAQWEAAA